MTQHFQDVGRNGKTDANKGQVAQLCLQRLDRRPTPWKDDGSVTIIPRLDRVVLCTDAEEYSTQRTRWVNTAVLVIEEN